LIGKNRGLVARGQGGRGGDREQDRLKGGSRKWGMLIEGLGEHGGDRKRGGLVENPGPERQGM